MALNITDVIYNRGTSRISDQPGMPITNADWASANTEPDEQAIYQQLVADEQLIRSTPSNYNAGTATRIMPGELLYDPAYPVQIRGVDPREQYAQQQSAAGKIFNGITGGALKVGTKTLQSVGFLAGLAGLDNDYKKYGGGLEGWIAGAADNAFATFFEDIENNINDKWFKQYQSIYDQNQGFGWRALNDLDFWTNDVVDAIAFMTSAFVPGIGISKLGLGAKVVKGAARARGLTLTDEALEAAGKAFSGSLTTTNETGQIARLMNGISNAKLARNINVGATTLVNTLSESMWEARETKNSILDALNNNPETANLPEDEKLRRAATGAMNVMGSNMGALLVSNLWEANFMFKRLPSTSSDLVKNFNKSGLFAAPELVKRTGLERFITRPAKVLGEGIITEGFYEENIQLAISRLNEEMALDPDYRGNYFANLAEQTIRQTVDAISGKDTEAGVSIGLGAIVGGGMSLIGNVRKGLSDRQRMTTTQQNIANATKAFRAIGEIYETEKYTETDSEGNTIEKERVVLDENGHPKFNEAKLIGFLADQSRILELDAIATLSQEEQKEFLAQTYQDELFSKFALAHFEAGLGDLLLEKLDDAVNLTDDDLSIMGYDPTSREFAAIKQAELKQQALELQRIYDDVQRNVVDIRSNPNEDQQRAFANRKDEIFRLHSRRMSIDRQLAKANSKVIELQAKLDSYDSSYNSADDSIVSEANKLIIKSTLADKFLEQLTEQFEAAKLIDGEASITEEALNEAKNNSEEAQRELKEYFEEHQEKLDKLKKDKEGLYSFEKRSKNSLPENRDLKIAQLKAQELILSRNSVLERLGKLSNLSSGQAFYDKFVKQIELSKRPSFTSKKIDLKGKTLEDYIAYEQQRFRRSKIETLYGNILREHTAEQLLEELEQMSLQEINQMLNDLLNQEVALPKEKVDLIVEKISGVLEGLIQTQNAEITRLTEENEAISNDVPLFNHPELGPIYGTMTDEQIQKTNENSERIAELQEEVRVYEDMLEKASQLKIHEGSELTENQVLREIADEYFIDPDIIVTDISQSEEGYDTPEDLQNAQDQIDQLKSLKEIFLKRQDLLASKEFHNFISEIDSRLEKLEEAKKVIEKRVGDRSLQDSKALSQALTLQSLSLGFDGDNYTPIKEILEELVTQHFPVEAASILQEIEKHKKNTDSLELQSALGAYEDIIQKSFNKLSEAERKVLKEKIESEYAGLVDKLFETDLAKNAAAITPKLKSEYYKNPVSLWYLVLNSGVFDRNYSGDKDSKSPIRIYNYNFNILTLLENVSNDPRIGSRVSKEDLTTAVELQVKIGAIDSLKRLLNSSYTNLTEVDAELKTMEKEEFAPSNQQLISLRQLVKFFYTLTGNEPFQTTAYIKGIAGSGKSSLVAKWLPKLLKVPLDEIFAIGHTSNSSNNINQLLGKGDIVPTTEELIKQLESNKKLRLILVDEIGGFSKEAFTKIAEAVQKYNEKKEPKDYVKMVFLGDPTQLNTGDTGKLQARPDIEELSTLVDHKNMTIVNPLTIRYRSNINQISNFSDKFIRNEKDISKENIIVKSNNPTLATDTIQDGNLLGIVGTKSFESDLSKIVNNSNLEDGKTRVIITNSNPQKIERLRKLTGNKIEVLSYIDAQGRTFDEVYVDIDNNNEFPSASVFNQAMYVASSRARNFILVSNLNITNEEDLTIDEDAQDKVKDIQEGPTKFKEDRKKELKTIEELTKTSVPKENKTPTPTKEEEKKPPVKETISDILHETEEDEFSETELTEETYDDLEQGPVSTKEKADKKKTTQVDTKTEVVYTVKHPTYTATKNFVTTSEGTEIEVSDEGLKHLSEGYTVNHQSVKIGDRVLYAPIATKTGRVILLLSPRKNAEGKEIKGSYVQVGMLGESNLSELPDGVRQVVESNLSDENAATNEGIFLASKIINLGNKPLVSIAEGTIASIEHLSFSYDPKKYSTFNLRSIVEQVTKQLLGDDVDPREIDKVQQDAKILIFTNNQLANIREYAPYVKAGIPYLRIRTPKGATNAKFLYIRLDRRGLNKRIHSDLLEPINTFIKSTKKLNNLLKENFTESTVWGNPKVNKVLKQLRNADTNEKALEIIASLGEMKDPSDIEKILKLTKEITDLWLTPIKNTRYYNGTKVQSTSEPFTRVYTHQKDGVHQDGTEYKQGDVYIKEESGIVVGRKFAEDPNTGENRVSEVEVQYSTLNEENVKETTTRWVPVEDLTNESTEDGAAQKALTLLFKAQADRLFQLEGMPIKTLEYLIDGRKVKTTTARSLFSDNAPWRSIEELEELFTFNSKGEHTPKWNGERIDPLRVPVPIRKKQFEQGININFTDSTENAVNHESITDYFIQSNFQGVSPTSVSIKHDKPKKPVHSKENKSNVVQEQNVSRTKTNTKASKTVPSEETKTDTIIEIPEETKQRTKRKTRNVRKMAESSPITGQLHSNTDLGDAISTNKAIQLIRRLFPNLSLEEVKKKVVFIKNAADFQKQFGQDGWGAFSNNLIYLKQNPDGTVYTKVIYHEVFHAIYNKYLTAKERQRVKEIVLNENPKAQFLTETEQEEYIDEYLAELYMENAKPKHYFIRYILEKIKKLLTFVLGIDFNTEVNNITELLDAINSGKLVNRIKYNKKDFQTFVDKSLESGTLLRKC